MPPITITALSAARQIEREAWEHLAPGGHPFLNADFLNLLEQHGTAGPSCGWHARHLLATDADGAAIGILPTYIKANSHGDFVRDWSWAAAYGQLGKTYYPKLLSGLPHTPASGPRLLVASGAGGDEVKGQLIEAAKALVADNGFSSWHVALPADDEVDLLRAHGLLVSHDVQFHWRDHGYGDFDGFLAAFPSAKRRKVRAERRKVADSGVAVDVRHGDEIAPEEWPALHRLYTATFDKYGNYAAFSAACFADLAAALGRRMVVFIARQRDAPVAVSLCFRSDDTLYGRYWGSNGDFHSLHFELCFYQGITYCLREGLTTFEPGAGGEHKVARGFAPTIVRSCHWIEDARMRQLIGQFLERNRPAVIAYAEAAAQHLPFKMPAT
ncbi:GNAT family N-acetyltransferase [Dechloromonas sp. H13]|uniref:GNAT family N-acetyltransferase n=1 Tax=Dechloromonas sp. H13 TaxID=2570193 RepID=UPI0012926DA9|nr:GNAT family N-acetyltransferase [Dechloromonas sp. H13]